MDVLSDLSLNSNQIITGLIAIVLVADGAWRRMSKPPTAPAVERGCLYGDKSHEEIINELEGICSLLVECNRKSQGMNDKLIRLLAFIEAKD